MTKELVEVLVPIPLEGKFSYKIPSGLKNEDFQPGVRVEVPFGKRTLIGIVWGKDLNSDKTIGVTWHKMNNFIDKGDIVLQKKIFISKKDSIFFVYKKSFEISANLLIKSLKKILHKKKYVKNKLKSSYNIWPSKDDWKIFRKKNKKFI